MGSGSATIPLVAGDNHVVIALTPGDGATVDVVVALAVCQESWDVTKNTYFAALEPVFAFINSEESPSNDYTVTLYADGTTAPTGFLNKNVTLTSGGPKTVSLTETVPMFVIMDGTLTLNGDIVLQGHVDNYIALVMVSESGTLTMSDNAKITGNTSDVDGSGGGVMNLGGHFTMEGGTISRNDSDYGSGVYISTSEFSKTGGIIYGSTDDTDENANTVTTGDGSAISA
jgi:hypothetical protein